MNPVQKRIALRKLFKGVAGRHDPELEDVAMRAIASRLLAEQRVKTLQAMALQRKIAVEQRKRHQMVSAEYARDRRRRAAS